MRLLAAALALACGCAFAQSDKAALEACRAYAKRDAAREGTRASDIVLERDGNLHFERAARKAGSQPMSALLTGNGAVVFADAPSAELSFICLLADEKRPFFFSWLPRRQVSAMMQCARSEPLRRNPNQCLEVLERFADDELLHLYAQEYQDATARGADAVAAYRKANDAWRGYRDAECARRRAEAPQGVSPDDFQRACVIDLTRRRALDLR
jgi:uncharacterized protein YecT (DUF1311 family)